MQIKYARPVVRTMHVFFYVAIALLAIPTETLPRLIRRG